MLRPFLLAIYVLLFTPTAMAHDSWISSGGYRNGLGEWCCGENDCTMLEPSEVREQFGGWHVVFPASNAVGRQTAVDEFVPYAEAKQSPDGRYWRCRRADGTRRCWFAPPGSV